MLLPSFTVRAIAAALLACTSNATDRGNLTVDPTGGGMSRGNLTVGRSVSLVSSHSGHNFVAKPGPNADTDPTRFSTVFSGEETKVFVSGDTPWSVNASTNLTGRETEPTEVPVSSSNSSSQNSTAQDPARVSKDSRPPQTVPLSSAEPMHTYGPPSTFSLFLPGSISIVASYLGINGPKGSELITYLVPTAVMYELDPTKIATTDIYYTAVSPVAAKSAGAGNGQVISLSNGAWVPTVTFSDAPATSLLQATLKTTSGGAGGGGGSQPSSTTAGAHTPTTFATGIITTPPDAPIPIPTDAEIVGGGFEVGPCFYLHTAASYTTEIAGIQKPDGDCVPSELGIGPIPSAEPEGLTAGPNKHDHGEVTSLVIGSILAFPLIGCALWFFMYFRHTERYRAMVAQRQKERNIRAEMRRKAIEAENARVERERRAEMERRARVERRNRRVRELGELRNGRRDVASYYGNMDPEFRKYGRL